MTRRELNRRLREAGWVVASKGVTYIVWRRKKDDRPDAPRIRVRVGPWIPEDIATRILTTAIAEPPLR